jgi:hypothetical protein
MQKDLGARSEVDLQQNVAEPLNKAVSFASFDGYRLSRIDVYCRRRKTPNSGTGKVAWVMVLLSHTPILMAESHSS